MNRHHWLAGLFGLLSFAIAFCTGYAVCWMRFQQESDTAYSRGLKEGIAFEKAFACYGIFAETHRIPVGCNIDANGRITAHSAGEKR